MAAPDERLAQAVDRAVYRALTLFTLVNLAVSVRNTVAKPQLYPEPAGYLGCLALAGATAWCAWDCRARVVRSWSGLRAATLISVALTVMHVVGYRLPGAPDLGPGDYPPLLHGMGASMTGVASAFGQRVAVGSAIGYAVGFSLVRQPSIGLGNAVGESLLLLVSLLAASMILTLTRRAQREVAEAADDLLTQRQLEATEAAEVRERTRWDALIHDTVLGALRLAGTARDAADDQAARQLAEQALVSLRGRTEPVVEPAASALRRHARRAGLDASIDVVEGSPLPDVRQAMLAAAQEAITNVARHAGVSRLVVRGWLGATQASLTIIDHGVGFRTHPTSRGLGVHHAITARMLAVGGQAHVVSRPGQGTTVALTWRPGPAGSVPLRWPVRCSPPCTGSPRASSC